MISLTATSGMRPPDARPRILSVLLSATVGRAPHANSRVCAAHLSPRVTSRVLDMTCLDATPMARPRQWASGCDEPCAARAATVRGRPCAAAACATHDIGDLNHEDTGA